MGTTNYNFTTISGTDPINIVNAINVPLQEIDTKMKEISDAQGGDTSEIESRLSALEAFQASITKGTTYDDLSTNGFLYKAGD